MNQNLLKVQQVINNINNDKDQNRNSSSSIDDMKKTYFTDDFLGHLQGKSF